MCECKEFLVVDDEGYDDYFIHNKLFFRFNHDGVELLFSRYKIGID